MRFRELGLEVGVTVTWRDGEQVVLHDPRHTRKQVLGSLLHAVYMVSLQALAPDARVAMCDVLRELVSPPVPPNRLN